MNKEKRIEELEINQQWRDLTDVLLEQARVEERERLRNAVMDEYEEIENWQPETEVGQTIRHAKIAALGKALARMKRAEQALREADDE